VNRPFRVHSSPWRVRLDTGREFAHAYILDSRSKLGIPAEYLRTVCSTYSRRVPTVSVPSDRAADPAMLTFAVVDTNGVLDSDSISWV
jgi:hypothetical protein